MKKRSPANHKPTVFCTIIAKNYLSQARLLAKCLKRHHPTSPFLVLLADRVDGYFDPAQEPFTLVEIDKLPIPNLRRFCFQYSVIELCTAAKPYFLEWLLTRYGAKELVYLDPDIMVYRPLEKVIALLKSHPILLTPHITQPYPDSRKPNELDILRAGTFNLGFLALRKSKTALELLTWWKSRLYSGCRMELDRGMHVDQKWMDLVPSFFPQAFILRDPAFNVAYWNLDQREVRDCRFFHFSGFDPLKPEVISKHQDRLTMEKIGRARDLFDDYRLALKENGYYETIFWPNAFGFFDNAETIPQRVRQSYLNLGERAEAFGDPFHTSAPNNFYEWARHNLRSTSEKSSLPFGLNVSGYFQSEKGVGEAARSFASCLSLMKVPFVLNNVVDSGSNNEEFPSGNFSNAHPFATNCFAFIGFEELLRWTEKTPRHFRNRYNIGYLAWELSSFPKAWQPCLSLFDEIWTLSEFSREALARVSPVPVRVMPLSIPPRKGCDRQDTREHFSLPKSAFCFLSCFDFHSSIERKNPLATIQAFREAFQKDPKAILVLKSMHASHLPEDAEKVREAIGSQPNIRWIDEVLSRSQMQELISACDAYVSLHRAEGFGLPLAESMALGKPVIATAYSGNLDFMTEQNSFLIPYRAVTNEKAHLFYDASAVWAEADVKSAAKAMRRVFENRKLANQLGKRARSDIKSQWNEREVGRQITWALLQRANAGRKTQAQLPPLWKSLSVRGRQYARQIYSRLGL